MISQGQIPRPSAPRTRACGALFVVLALLFSISAASAQQGSDDDPGGRVRVLSSSYDADTTWTSLIGGSRRGTLTVTLKNISEETVSGIDMVLTANGNTRRLDPIDLAVDETRTVSFPVNFDEGQWGPQDITATFNGFDVDITHWNMPWILIGLVAFVINLLLLTIRNGLRNRVRKQLVAQRRAKDLGHAEAPQGSLAPVLSQTRQDPPRPNRGSSQLRSTSCS